MCKDKKIKGYQSIFVTMNGGAVSVTGTTNIPFKFNYEFPNFFGSFNLSQSDPVLITRIDVFPNLGLPNTIPTKPRYFAIASYWGFRMWMQSDFYITQKIQPPIPDPFNDVQFVPQDVVRLNFSTEKNWFDCNIVAKGFYIDSAFCVFEGLLPDGSADVFPRMEFTLGIHYEEIIP